MKILLVEDNLVNVTFVKFMLEESGYEVVVANDGYDAIDCLYNDDFSVIIMDLQMPVLDGLAVTKTIRADVLLKEKANTPIIIMSSSVSEQEKKKMFEAGADGYIEKPDEISILLSTISTVVDRRARLTA